jgi:hypothetical protein
MINTFENHVAILNVLAMAADMEKEQIRELYVALKAFMSDLSKDESGFQQRMQRMDDPMYNPKRTQDVIEASDGLLIAIKQLLDRTETTNEITCMDVFTPIGYVVERLGALADRMATKQKELKESREQSARLLNQLSEATTTLDGCLNGEERHPKELVSKVSVIGG